MCQFDTSYFNSFFIRYRTTDKNNDKNQSNNYTTFPDYIPSAGSTVNCSLLPSMRDNFSENGKGEDEEEVAERCPEEEVYLADPDDLEVVPVPCDPVLDAYLQSPVPIPFPFPVESTYNRCDVTDHKRIVRQRIRDEKFDLSR
jgi:hypothetical protein